MPDSPPPSLCHAGSPEHPQKLPEDLVLHRFERVASTNDLARAWLAGAPHHATGVWIAREQTAGRGTRGRSWASPPGGLWMSVATSLGARPDRALPGLGLRIGLATLLACRESLPPDSRECLRIRWPNDLIALPRPPHASVRKVGGTLIDHISARVVIGIGINANNELPVTDGRGEALRTLPVSLSDLSGGPIDLRELEQGVLTHLLRLAPTEGISDILKGEIERNLFIPQEPVGIRRPNGGEFLGQVKGISTAPGAVGGLIVQDEQEREHVITSGDIL